jgi:hypothetical protein
VLLIYKLLSFIARLRKMVFVASMTMCEGGRTLYKSVFIALRKHEEFK